jgi:hypothetical protein
MLCCFIVILHGDFELSSQHNVNRSMARPLLFLLAKRQRSRAPLSPRTTAVTLNARYSSHATQVENSAQSSQACNFHLQVGKVPLELQALFKNYRNKPMRAYRTQ